MKRALVTGAYGHDARHLIPMLLNLGYSVDGLVRQIVGPHPDGIKLYQCDLIREYREWKRLFHVNRYDEVYHLAGRSTVYDLAAEETYHDWWATATIDMMKLLWNECPGTRLFIASSSEVFGGAEQSPQNESTPFNPVSVYGEARARVTRYAESFRSEGAWVSVGIMFNHVSTHQAPTFLVRKVCKAAVDIKTGLKNILYLGDLNAARDWGWAPEYMDAAIRSLNVDIPRTYVLSTGVSTKVSRVAELAFKVVGLTWGDYVQVGSEFTRPEETIQLIGDSYLAFRALSWRHSTSLEKAIDTIVWSDYKASIAEGNRPVR